MEQPIVVDARERYLTSKEESVYTGPDDTRVTIESALQVGKRQGISVGMIALGLELETSIRLSERFGTLTSDELIAQHVANSLRDLLRRVGIYDDVLDEYERQANLLARERVCDHEWIDARNEVIESGWYCRKCMVMSADGVSPVGAQHESASSSPPSPLTDAVARTARLASDAVQLPEPPPYESVFGSPVVDKSPSMRARIELTGEANEVTEALGSWGRTLHGRSNAGPAKSFGSEGTVSEG